MKIFPIYTQTNQICNVDNAFFKLLYDYSPAFIFLTKNTENNNRFSVIGRNPIVTFTKKNNDIKLKITNEILNISSENLSLSEIIDKLYSILELSFDETLDENTPFYLGLAGFKKENETFFMLPSEVIIFDHYYNNLTCVINTYAKEGENEDMVCFNANIKIARIINELKNETNSLKIEKSHEKKVYDTYIKDLYSHYIAYIKHEEKMLLTNQDFPIFKTKINSDKNVLMNFLENSKNYVGYFNFNLKSTFIEPKTWFIENI